MPQGSVDRRRGRRARVRAPLTIRRLGSGQPGVASQEEVTENISLAGVYFETEHDGAYDFNDVILASVAIPEPQTRHFPFTRISGRSRVVRINELPRQGSTGHSRFGVALEFGDDLTALTAIPTRG